MRDRPTAVRVRGHDEQSSVDLLGRLGHDLGESRVSRSNSVKAEVADALSAHRKPDKPTPSESSYDDRPIAQEARPSLRRNVLWSFFGTMLNALCNWLSLFVVARLGTPQDVGTFALAGAVCTPIFIFFNLQLRGLQATDATGKFRFSTFWSIRLLTTLGAFALLAAYSMLFEDEPVLRAVIVVTALAKSFQAMSDIIHGFLQNSEEIEWIARSMAMRGVVSLALLSALFALTRNIVIATVAMAAAALVVLLLVDFRRVRRWGVLSFREAVQVKVPRAELRSILASALPLGAALMVSSITIHLPTYLLEAFASRADVGYFAAASQLVAAGSLAIGAVAQAASPRLAKYAAGRFTRQFRMLLLKMILFAFALGLSGTLIAVFGGEALLAALFAPGYEEAWGALVILSIAAAFNFASSISGYAMTALGLHAVQFPMAILVLVLALFSGRMLVPEAGLLGAAISVLIVGIGSFSVSVAVVVRRVRVL